MRFPKTARLSRTSEFHKVRDEGRSWGGRYFVLGVLETGFTEAARLGIITTRRLGGAVERNRARRKIREVIRDQLAGVRDGCWLVVIARKRVLEAKPDELRTEWMRLAGKAGILQGQEEFK